MDNVNFILVLGIIFSLGLGLNIFWQSRRNRMNLAFALISLFLVFWQISIFNLRIGQGEGFLIFWARFLLFFGGAIGLLFLYLTFSFRPRLQKIKQSKFWLVFWPGIFLNFLILLPFFSVAEIAHNEKGQIIFIWSSGLLLYFVFYLFYWFLAAINFLKKIRQAKFLSRSAIFFFVPSFFLPLAFLPLSYLSLFNQGSYFLILLSQLLFLIFLGALGYLITRYEILNFQLILARLISLLLLSILTINVFYFADFIRLALNLGVLALGIAFSVALTTLVLRENDYRDKTKILVLRLSDVRREFTKLNRLKSEFVSLASHQLRTPLSAIKGYVAMLLEDVDEPENRNALNKIYMSNERLIGLVNDLVNLSRAEQGKLKCHFKEGQLEEILSSVISDLQVIATPKKIKIIYAKHTLPAVRFDQDKIRQVFTNLIENALQYTFKGKITIKADLSESDETIIVSIKDTGIGMQKSELKSIFKKFERGKSGKKTYPDGTGIGLYIARRYVDAHNGKLWAESRGRGKGSTFYVKLPIATS